MGSTRNNSNLTGWFSLIIINQNTHSLFLIFLSVNGHFALVGDHRYGSIYIRKWPKSGRSFGGFGRFECFAHLENEFPLYFFYFCDFESKVERLRDILQGWRETNLFQDWLAKSKLMPYSSEAFCNFESKVPKSIYTRKMP